LHALWLLAWVLLQGEAALHYSSASQTHHTGGEGMQVREIMSKDIEVVDRNDNLRTVEERMVTKPHSTGFRGKDLRH